MTIADTTLADRLTIEPMTLRDLRQVLTIEKASFRHPWTYQGFQTEMTREPARCLVLRDGNRILGYLVIWLLPPEVHVLNVAVHPDLRRMGLGRLLLEYLIELGRESGATEIYLEVRASNRAAQTLYESAGFIVTGRRPKYYAEEGEDALLMTKEL